MATYQNEINAASKLINDGGSAFEGINPEYAARMRDDGGKDCEWIGWIEPLEDNSAAWIRSSPFPNAALRHRIGEAVPHLALAAAGAGLTMLPCFAGDRHPGLVRAPFHEPVLDRSIWLLLHGDLRQTARIRLFIDFMVARIRSRRAELQGDIQAAGVA